jgi:hypothetical protein
MPATIVNIEVFIAHRSPSSIKQLAKDLARLTRFRGPVAPGVVNTPVVRMAAPGLLLPAIELDSLIWLFRTTG